MENPINKLREDILLELKKYKETEGFSGVTLSSEQVEQLRQWARINLSQSFDKYCDDCVRNFINRTVNRYL